jgi:tryptophan synthase alpha chain
VKNRIEAVLAAAEREGRKLFSAYLTLGYPNLKFTEKLIRQFERIGVDFIELGFPFSDPLADGPVIQAASEKVLRKGISMKDGLRLAERLRRSGVKIPLLFFSYYNPIFHFGLDRFAAKIARSGFDGLICPDLPPDEDAFFSRAVKKNGLSMVFLASPTTDEQRLRLIARRSTGFIYYVSLKGVTGIRKSLSRDLGPQVRRIGRLTAKPVLIGFGVSSPAQVREAARHSNGVIVGSAIIDAIRRSGARPAPVVAFVKSLVQAAR